MKTYCGICKKIMPPKLLVLEELRRIDTFSNCQTVLFVARKNLGSVKTKKLVD